MEISTSLEFSSKSLLPFKDNVKFLEQLGAVILNHNTPSTKQGVSVINTLNGTNFELLFPREANQISFIDVFQISKNILGMLVLHKNDKVELFHIDLQQQTFKLSQSIKTETICPILGKFHLSRPLKLTIFSFCPSLD